MDNYDKEVIKLILGNNKAWIEDENGNFIFASDDAKPQSLEQKKLGGISYVSEDGKYYKVQEEYAELEGERVKICRLQDITKLLISFKEVQELAERREQEMNTDPLTGTFTKQGFKKKVKELQNKNELCLAMVDLDNFKNINDSYGHTVADEVLRVIGLFLIDQFRKNDIIGRFGGDEFIIACPNSSAEGIAKKLEQVRKNILELTNNKINITIGITKYDDDLNYDDNVQKADIALYNGKQGGKGTVVIYSPEIEKITDLKITNKNDNNGEGR